MAVQLLCLYLLLASLCTTSSALYEKQTCNSLSFTCGSCLQGGPECVWCTDPGLPVDKFRCTTLEEMQESGCGSGHIYYPQGSVAVIKNDSRTSPAEPQSLQPQVVKLTLRPRVVQTFPLTVYTAAGQSLSTLSLDIGQLPRGVSLNSTVTTGENPVIQISVIAGRCLRGSWSVPVTPRGFAQSLELQITLQCQCDCMHSPLEDSPVCMSRGALVCGQCECHKPYIGHRCETDLNLAVSDSSCGSSPVCGGNGQCIRGECMCRQFEDPTKHYYGQYCECDDFLCPRHENRLCAGHGHCECGQCICYPGWTGMDCSCSLNTSSCLATNQQLCNGRGSCDCGTCRCHGPKFQGPTCEECPTCPGVCGEHWDCVQCRAFGTGSMKDLCDEKCGYFSLSLVDKEAALPEPGPVMSCRHRDENGCWVFFQYSKLPGGRAHITATAKDCPPGDGST